MTIYISIGTSIGSSIYFYISIHGTEVLSGSSVHPIVVTTIWKAYWGIKNCKTIVKPLLKRCVIRVDGRSSQAWEDLTKLKIKHLTMAPPHGYCQSFFLLLDLKQGSQGRIWLAISKSNMILGHNLNLLMKLCFIDDQKRPLENNHTVPTLNMNHWLNEHLLNITYSSGVSLQNDRRVVEAWQKTWNQLEKNGE